MGLRISEGLQIEVGDICAEKGLLHIRNSKGNKDRIVNLPALACNAMRKWWSIHHHPQLLFPAIQISYGKMSVRDVHMDIGSTQSAIKKAAHDCGLKKRVSSHTLRHSYATHLLERNVSIIAVKHLLGHACIKTTEKYLHRTKIMNQDAVDVCESILSDLEFSLRKQ